MPDVTYICIILLTFWIKLFNWITWDPPDPTFNYYTSLAFNYDFINEMTILQSKYFATSGHTYHYIDVNNTDDVMIVKMDSDDQIIWYRHYITPGLMHTFDVAPDESTFVFFEDVSEIRAYKFNGTDGTFMAAFKQSSMMPDWFNTTHLSYADDSQSVWYVARTASTYIHLWSWDIGLIITCMRNAFTDYGMVNSINAFNSSVAFVTIEKLNNSAVEINKMDLSQSSNFYLYWSRINCSYCQTMKDSLYLDSLNDRIYAGLIHDDDFMFLVLQMSTGNQASGTSIFRSNNNWVDKHVFRIHLYNNKVYIPALCDKSTLFEYDIDSDTIISIYQPATTNIVFRNVYFKDSRLYITGHQLISGKRNAWIGTTSPDSIDTLPLIASTIAFPMSIDTVANHVPHLISNTNHSLASVVMASYTPQTSLTGNFVLKNYLSKLNDFFTIFNHIYLFLV